MAVTKYIVFHLNDQKYSMKLTKINGIEYVYHVVPVPMGPLPESDQEEIVISIAVDTLMSDHEFGQIENALEKEMRGK